VSDMGVVTPNTGYEGKFKGRVCKALFS